MTDEDQAGERQATRNRPTTAEEWAALPRHPDPREDLGYELVALERIETPGRSDDVVYLPMDESLLRDDSFMVVGPRGHCDLGAKR